MNDRHAWFPEFDPLPSGERRLRLAMGRRPVAPAWRWAPVAAACALLLVAVAVWPPVLGDARIHGALRTAWALPEGPRIENGHSRALASGDADVRLYAVVIAPAAPRTTRP